MLRRVCSAAIIATLSQGVAKSQPVPNLPDLRIEIITIEPGARGSVVTQVTNAGSATSGLTKVRLLVAGGDGSIDVTLYQIFAGGAATAVLRGSFEPGE